MPSASLLQIAGSKPKKETRYAPIFTDRFFVGLWTNRNPLRSPLSTFYADGWHLGGTDALLAGTNVELSPRLTLCRRPGNVSYSAATIPTPPLTFYGFQTFGGGIDVMVDTSAEIYTLTATTRTSVFAKDASAGQTNFMGIGGTLYFGDGAEVKAWQNGTIRNWGISIGPFSNSIGPTATTSGASSGSPAWTNPSNITLNNPATPASCSVPAGFISGQLSAGGFGFSIPVGINITGVEVTVTGSTTLSSAAQQLFVQLFNGSSPVGSVRGGNGLPASTGSITLGGQSDLWGLSASAMLSLLNSASFQAQSTIFNTSGTSSATENLTFVTVTVFGAFGPTLTKVGSGTFSATAGYEYVAAYGNSSSGQVSSVTPSSSTGTFSNIDHVGVALTASSDPQVDQIWVFRTADGGSTFLNLPNSPFANTTATVTDNAADAELNILQQAPINSVNNPPPPVALDPVQYLGIPWVHYGNAVAFGRAPSAIVGSQWESFPPANTFTFPETVVRKVPFNNGLLVFTTANVFIIAGQNTASSVLYSAPFLAGFGLLSWNALAVDGSIIYFFDAKKRLIRLDPSSGVEDMGFPIGDQLAALNPASVHVAYYSNTSNDAGLYIGDGSTGWYRCNPNQAPDAQITGPVWSPKATITGGLGALASINTAPGVPALMMGGTGNNQPVLTRDSTFRTFTDNGTPYAANCTIGSVVLAQPGQAAICRFITVDAVRTGTSPIISVLLGEISGSFENISGYVVNDPPYLTASTSLYNNRHYFKQTVGGAAPQPTICRHLQIHIDLGSDSVQNEILSLTVNGAIYLEK